jgi:hypothetical protein
MPEKVSVRPERCFAILLVMLLSFAGLSPAKTTVDFDPQIDFSQYKTFGFIGGVGNLVMLELDPDFIYTRIHQNIVRELTKKGLQEAFSSQKPDLVVRYWVAPESQVNVVAMGEWAPYAAYLGDYWSNSYNSVVSSNNRVSNLIIDVIDAHTKSLVWRLYISRKLADPEKDWKRIDDEFVEGFKSYPPSAPEKESKRKERAAQKPAPASD